MKSFRSTRGIVALLIFIGFAYAVVSLRQSDGIQLNMLPTQPIVITEDFKTLNRDLWYVGQWLTDEPAYDKIKLESETISLPVEIEDEGPYLISRPIKMEEYNVVTIKRRVKVHAGSDYFVGGLGVFQTDSSTMKPGFDEFRPYGSPVVLVEYAYDYGIDTKRPGDENIRLLAPNWEADDNYALLPPIFDKWFNEELVIDNVQGKVFYTVNERTIEVDSSGIQYPYFRIFMHSFGAYTGHNVMIDNIEITLSKSDIEVAESEELNE